MSSSRTVDGLHAPESEKNEDKEWAKAKSDALKLLSFRPRSVAELRQRLKMKHFSDSLVERVLDLFQSQGLLNDEKFARFLVDSAAHNRPAGKKHLEFELKKKGLASDVIVGALAQHSEEREKEMALEAATLRFEKMTGVSAEKKKMRLFGFLKRRGFSDEVVYSVMNALVKK